MISSKKIPPNLFARLFFSIFRPFIYCAASWISRVCFSLSATGRPKTFWSFYAQPPPAALHKKADNTKVISAPPQHCTNITLIETFTPKPTVGCEILSQAATEDLAEGIKAGKDEM